MIFTPDKPSEFSYILVTVSVLSESETPALLFVASAMNRTLKSEYLLNFMPKIKKVINLDLFTKHRNMNIHIQVHEMSGAS